MLIAQKSGLLLRIFCDEEITDENEEWVRDYLPEELESIFNQWVDSTTLRVKLKEVLRNKVS